MSALDIKIVDTVREQVAMLGYSPTLRKMARWHDTTLGSVAKAVERLVDAGVLTRIPGKARSLRIAGEPDLRLVPTEAMEIELGRRGVTFRALSRVEPLQPNRGAPCAATVCDQSVRRGHLFCYRHWSIIPRETQTEILRAFGRRDAEAYEMAITRALDVIDGCGDGWERRA